MRTLWLQLRLFVLGLRINAMRNDAIEQLMHREALLSRLEALERDEMILSARLMRERA